jgi:hypothetical protein
VRYVYLNIQLHHLGETCLKNELRELLRDEKFTHGNRDNEIHGENTQSNLDPKHQHQMAMPMLIMGMSS